MSKWVATIHLIMNIIKLNREIGERERDRNRFEKEIFITTNSNLEGRYNEIKS